MDISPDNRWIVTVTTRRAQPSLRDVWDGHTGSHITGLATDTSFRYGTLRISPDNKYVAIYNIPAGMLLWPLSLPTASVAVVTGGNQRSLSVYPNPSRVDVNVEWHQADAETVRLRIFTAEGESVYTTDWVYREPGICRERIPTEHLALGAYFCEIESAGGDVSVPSSSNINDRVTSIRRILYEYEKGIVVPSFFYWDLCSGSIIYDGGIPINSD